MPAPPMGVPPGAPPPAVPPGYPVHPMNGMRPPFPMNPMNMNQMPLHPMNPMSGMNPMAPMPPIANPYRTRFVLPSHHILAPRANGALCVDSEAAIAQARFAQMQRAKAIHEMAAQRAATEKVEQNGNTNGGPSDITNGGDAKPAETEGSVATNPAPAVYKDGVSLYVGKLCKEIDDGFFEKLLNV